MLAATALACLLASTSGPASPKDATRSASTASRKDATGSASTATAGSETVHLDVDELRNQALLVLVAGVGVSVVSGVAFVTGFDAERELRASVHGEAAADALLNKRTI